MEKINTPLMAQIEIEQKRNSDASKRYNVASRVGDDIGMQLAKNNMIESAHCLSVLKSLLPAEREAMVSMAENAYWDIVGSGVISTSDKKEIRDDSEKLFNENFKSYE